MSGPAVPARAPSSDAGPLLLVFLPVFLALHVHGLFGLPIAERIEIKPWNLTVPAALLVWLALAGRSRVKRLEIDGALCVFALALSTIWLGLSVARSPQLPAASAVFAVQVLNLVLFAAVAGLAGTARDLDSVNRTIFGVGVVIASASLILYAGGLLAFAMGMTDGLEGTRIGASLDRGLALRLVGFTESPNFYSLYMTLPFLAGFALRSGIGRWLGLTVIGVSLLLSMSRSFVAAFLGTSLLLAAPRVWSRFTASRRYARAVRRGIMILGAIGVGLFLLSPELRTFLSARVTTVQEQSRFVLWSAVLESWHRPLLGEGLRSVDLAVGHFSHNTYLDHLVETGLIGLLAFAIFLAAVTYRGWRIRHRPGAMPWLQAWLIVLAMGGTFSLGYNPFLALTGGVVAGLAAPAAGAGGARLPGRVDGRGRAADTPRGDP